MCTITLKKASSHLVTLWSCCRKVTKLKKLSGHAHRIEILASTNSKKAPSRLIMPRTLSSNSKNEKQGYFFLATCLETIISIVTLEKPRHDLVMRMWQEHDEAFLSVTMVIFYFFACINNYLFDQLAWREQVLKKYDAFISILCAWQEYF